MMISDSWKPNTHTHTRKSDFLPDMWEIMHKMYFTIYVHDKEATKLRHARVHMCYMP